MISHSAGLMCVRSVDEFSLHLNLIVYCIACELPNKQHAGDKLILYFWRNFSQVLFAKNDYLGHYTNTPQNIFRVIFFLAMWFESGHVKQNKFDSFVSSCPTSQQSLYTVPTMVKNIFPQ